MPALPSPQGLPAVSPGPAAGCAGQLEGQGEGKVFANTATPWLFPQSYIPPLPKKTNLTLCCLRELCASLLRIAAGNTKRWRAGIIFFSAGPRSQRAARGEFTPRHRPGSFPCCRVIPAGWLPAPATWGGPQGYGKAAAKPKPPHRGRG